MKPRAEFLCEGSVHASTRVSIEYNSMHPSAKLQAYARRTTRRKHAASTFSVWMCDCEDYFSKKSLRSRGMREDENWCHSVSPKNLILDISFHVFSRLEYLFGDSATRA